MQTGPLQMMNALLARVVVCGECSISFGRDRYCSISRCDDRYGISVVFATQSMHPERAIVLVRKERVSSRRTIASFDLS